MEAFPMRSNKDFTPCFVKCKASLKGLKNMFEKLGNHFSHFGALKIDAF